MRFLYYFFVLSLALLCSINSFAQNDSIISEEEIIDPFEQFSNASFKLDYYHTEGYSYSDRYWYEIIVIDSLLILNFNCPQNDDWNFVDYQKQRFLSDEELIKLKAMLSSSKIGQKTPGNPETLGSGYGADRLIIQSKELKIDGGDTYIAVGNETSKKAFQKRINKEKKESSTLSGDYERVFRHLEGLFDLLPELLKSK